MRTKITLTPNDKSLIGKYSADSEHIHVLLDSTNGAFTVSLPDCRGGNQNELIFKNIGTNQVTLQPATGQYIDNALTHVVNPWDLVTLWSDLNIRWILLDSNTIQVIALTEASPIAVDLSRGHLYTVTLTAARQFQNPTNATNGYMFILRVKQGGSGSYAVTWGTKYRFSTDLPAPTASTAVGSIDYFGFIYNGADDKFDYIAEVKGFS